ncbi:hypothetical protein BaRGS_00010016 [Batillaria attramentaria]|uniref:Uncharacterized protein n=1 Tax=Batillaria attramentaria TaxID=370345 RepID=A0ABD0LI21_9CAEN
MNISRVHLYIASRCGQPVSSVWISADETLNVELSLSSTELYNSVRDVLQETCYRYAKVYSI